MTNLYQASINRYLDQVNKTLPAPEKFITISSHHQTIPSTGTFIFPKPQQPYSNSKTQYFISGISFPNLDDSLALRQTELHIQIICGGQTWVAGQLGLLDTHALKDLIIPIPAADVLQEIKLIIQNPTTENSHGSGALNYDVVVAPDFHAEDLPCYRQIIYPLPESGIIHDGVNTILGSIPNSIARIEVYVPADLDVELLLDYQPKIYCDNIAIEPVTRREPTSGATTHNQLSGPGYCEFLGYKTYSFDGNKFMTNSLIMLDKQQIPLGKIKYSIVEKQVVRMKNGYIGLAF
jgi:hypothetical protein